MSATNLTSLLRPIVQRGSRWARGLFARRRRRTRFQARRTLLWALFGILLLHGGLLSVALKSPRLRDPVYREREQLLRARLSAGKEPGAKLVLVMGTSRAGNAFDARRMEAILRAETGQPILAFNFAVPGEGPITQQIYLRRLLQNGIRPDFLVVEVLHAQFYDFGMPQEGGTMIPNRVLPSERDLVARYDMPMAEFEKSSRDLWLNPWGELRLPILLRVRSKLLPADACVNWNRTSDAWGWRPLTEYEKQPGNYGRNLQFARQSYEPVVRTFRPSAAAVRALQDTIDLCRMEKIRVMLVQLPESSEFRGWFTAQSKQTLVGLFENIAQERNCQWVDAHTWVPDGHFMDGHHLLPSGAILFSDQFARQALTPWLKATGTAGITERLR